MDFIRIAVCVPVVALATILPVIIAQIFDIDQLTSWISRNNIWTVFVFVTTDPNSQLLIVLLLRYYRLVGNICSYLFFYEATPVPQNPTVLPGNVHVILPTIDPENADFERCLTSCLEKKVGFITIVTVGERNLLLTMQAVRKMTQTAQTSIFNPVTKVRVQACSTPSKRRQVAHALDILAQDRIGNKDTIVVLLDDHVWWPSDNFLPRLLAPFEDKRIGFVGTNKRVAREKGSSFAQSFLNFIACLYLERHNFEIAATNAMDGGVFVVSGRTSAIRAEIVMDDQFRADFINERFFFGKFGPLNADDDNFITRWVVRAGWDIKIQHHPDALIATTLGTTGGYPKFWSQLLRWARTTWRSNSCSLFTDGTVWYRQPWCVHAVYLTSFANFALPVDALITLLWYRSSYSDFELWHLLALVFGSKLVKLVPFFLRHPEDVALFPFYIVFAYTHSFIKLFALITFYNITWGGRNLADVDTSAPGDSGDGDENQDNVSQSSTDHKETEAQLSDSSSTVDSDVGRDKSRYSCTSRCVSPSIPPFNVRPASGSPARNLRSHFSNPLRRDNFDDKRNRLDTPWGSVSRRDLFTKPANVREGTISNNSGRSSRSSNSSRSLRDLPISAPPPVNEPLHITDKSPIRVGGLMTPPPTVPPAERFGRFVKKDTSGDHHSEAMFMPSPTISPSFEEGLIGSVGKLECHDYIADVSDHNKSIASPLPFTRLDSFSGPTTRSTIQRQPTTTFYNPPAPSAPAPIPIILKNKTPLAVGHPYKRDFVRGEDCSSIHCDGDRFCSSTYSNVQLCEIRGFPNFGHAVVNGRPRL